MRKMIYEGKSKKLFETEDPQVLIQEFKDDATAFNAQKKEIFKGKGKANCAITTLIYNHLVRNGIPTHYLETLDETHMRVRRLVILPIEVIVRNRTAGSLAKRLGVEEGRKLSPPVVGFHLKDDKLGDPLVQPDELVALGFCKPGDLKSCTQIALNVNAVLLEVFDHIGIDLVDFKLEFGTDSAGKLMLADEISPDSCRFWDRQSGKKMDKDLFRRDLGPLVPAYEEVLRRLKEVI
jgi:phosphoribosylaminoimidazole-succinocarboxamide synthase